MPTVNEDFKKELRLLFKKGMAEALTSEWEVTDYDCEGDLKMAEFFMLTISSQTFRVVVVLHFTRNEELMTYAASKVGNTGNKSLEADKFYDYLGEVGNAFCGAIKRELGKTVATLGMSTPNRLSHDCMKFLEVAQDLESHACASLNGSRLLGASLFLYADEDLSYSVKRSVSDEEDVGSGELEFF